MYLVFDNETETHHSHKRKSNPFHPDNYVVLRGWKKEGDTRCSAERFEGRTTNNYLKIPKDVNLLVGHNIKFDLLYEMVNNNPDLVDFYKRGGRIWCTQYAEYLLRAQERSAQMVSMDSIAPSYGGRVKVDGLKALWDAGVLTSQIDKDLLLDYLVGTEDENRNSGDIGNTELIFLGQYQAAKELGMLQAITLRMDGLCATTEMEYRGLKIDVSRAEQNLKKLQTELDNAQTELESYISDIPSEVGFSWTSRVHTSCIIFGGTIKYKKKSSYIDTKTGELARFKNKEDWPLFNGVALKPTGDHWEPGEHEDTVDRRVRIVDGAYVLDTKCGDTISIAVQKQDTYKSGVKKGSPKFKKVETLGDLKEKYQYFFYELPGYTEPKPEWATKNVDGMQNPVYGTGSDIVEELSKRNVPFLKALGRLQALNKEIGTYYLRYDERRKEDVGMLTCVQEDDNIVHHSLNHTNTVTTRLSANNPNCQNIPRGDKSEVKSIFVSRFLDDGEMIEADYSQLEVVVQGLLSGDKNLCNDLINKIDFHCKRVALKNNIKYEDALYWCKDETAPDHKKWKTERTKCKIFSFQRAYGGGAALIADETGMELEEVQALIEKEDKEYKQIVKFNQSVEKEVVNTAEHFRDPTREFKQFRKGTWQAPTGTIYGWRSYEAPRFLKLKGITDTFKPTELKNYPVQGTGGEIVQMVLGILWRAFIKTDNFDGKAFLVNTVHDCVWIDTHKDIRDHVAKVTKTVMESVPNILKHYFNIDCPVPFPVEVEAGPNMLDLKHIL